MSLDLYDLRAKITPRTHAWLEARHRVTGEEVSAIVREILDAHAARELDIAEVTGGPLAARPVDCRVRGEKSAMAGRQEKGQK